VAISAKELRSWIFNRYRNLNELLLLAHSIVIDLIRRNTTIRS
jgi:hypothetical protein